MLPAMLWAKTAALKESKNTGTLDIIDEFFPVDKFGQRRGARNGDIQYVLVVAGSRITRAGGLRARPVAHARQGARGIRWCVTHYIPIYAS
jgi:hypothetical protein